MATSRMQEVQDAGRGIDEGLKTAGPMCGLKPSVQEISVEVWGQLAFPPVNGGDKVGRLC